MDHRDAANHEGRHVIRRVRHELRRRTLFVRHCEQLTPRMRRIVFESPELSDFVSSSHDDHVKLFFPVAGAEHEMRDLTPRAFSNEQCTLTIDFALHEAGVATQWAASAKVGDTLEIAGPRGSRIVPDDFDWYLLVADESALPAMGRWVEALRAAVPVRTIATIADERERQLFETRARWTATWLKRGEPSARDGELLLATLAECDRLPGDGFVWIAGEASIARAVHAHFVHERGHPRAWLRASGYWQRGEHAAHLELEE
jgi:NADPH-dependent ferric siderophore reductase